MRCYFREAEFRLKFTLLLGPRHTGEVRMVVDFKPSDSEVVEFKNGDHERIRVRPMYHELGFNNSPRIFGRQIVMESLLKALKL